MTKLQFLMSLHDKLSGLPKGDAEERMNFYSEMIEDRMEEGLSEEEAVAAVGTVEEIAAQIAVDIPPVKEKKPKRRMKAWEIVLLVLGSPVWLSLLIAAIAVGISLYASVWAIIISLWAVFGSLISCAIAGIVAGVGFAIGGYCLSGAAMIGAGFVCAGLAIFLFYGSKAVTKGTVRLTKKLALAVIRKEEPK